MKYILLSAAVAFFIISIHQLVTAGLLASYIFFMLTLMLIILARLTAVREGKKNEDMKNQDKKKESKKKK